MHRWLLLAGAAVAGACNSIAGLDELAFEDGPTSPAGAGAGTSTGTASGGAGGGGAASGTGAGAGGVAACGVTGPFDVGVASSVADLPFIAALPGRWGIAWNVGATTRFVAVGHDGVPSPSVPVGIPVAGNFETAVAATSDFFYVASNDDPRHPNGALHRLDVAGVEVAVLGADLPDYPSQMRATGRASELLVLVQVGGQALDAAVFPETTMTLSGFTTIAGITLSCCTSRDWQTVAHPTGFAISTDTAAPDKLVALDDTGALQYVTDEDLIPNGSGAAVGSHVYWATSGSLWRCSAGTSAWTCDSTSFVAGATTYRGITTDGNALWATTHDSAAMTLQEYDFDDGPSAGQLSIPGVPITRPVYAHDGDAWGVAWLEDDTIRFATAKYCP